MTAGCTLACVARGSFRGWGRQSALEAPEHDLVALAEWDSRLASEALRRTSTTRS